MLNIKAVLAAFLGSALLLTACSGGGGGGGGTTPPANQTPTANAGADQAVTSSQLVTLSGTGSDSDGSIASYAWSQTAGPAVTLSNSAAQNPSFTAPSVTTATVLGFSLVVRDNGGAASAADTVNITVNPPANPAPTANAGPDQTVQAAQVVTLAGSGTDSNGSIASYAWSQTAGPAVTLSSNSAQNPSFTAPGVTATSVLTFSLVVRDNGGAASAADTVNITVNPTPVAMSTVSGLISFDYVPHNTSTSGLNYAGTVQRAARGLTVQAIRSSDGSVLATAVTDASGNYSLTVPNTTTLFVRARAEMLKTGSPAWNFTVVDNTGGDALYALSSTAFDSGTGTTIRNLNAPSGFNASGMVTGTRSAAPFAILDSIYLAFNKVLATDTAASFPRLVVGWSPNNVPASGGNGTDSHPCAANGSIGTSFYTNGNICLLGAADNDTDEYDDHVIVHEWGHYFEDQFSRSDSIGGNHGSGDRLDMRVAFGEGFGNAWSGIVTDDPFYRDSGGSQQASGFAINVEANSNSNPGWYSERSVQSILYDLYDASSDGADTLTLGVAPILSVLRNQQRSGVPLTSIFSFITAFKAANPANAAAINSLVNAQSIVGDSIDAYGSTETNSAATADVLPIYTDISLNGGSRVVCSLNSFGEGNKLSVRRFLKFTLASSRTVSFSATGGSDPDMLLHRAGLIFVADSSASGSETFSRSLAAGDYVLEVLEFLNADDRTATGGRTCLTVAISG